MLRKYGIYGFDELGKTIYSISGNKVRKNYDLVVYDPNSKSFTDFSVLDGCDIIIFTKRMMFCPKSKAFVIDEVENILKKLKKIKFNGVLVFKQTFLPGTLDLWSEKYGLRIVHNPDFSSDKNLMSDFRRSDSQVVSGLQENRFRVMRAYEFLFNYYINFRQYDSFLVTEITAFMNSVLCASRFAIVRHFQELARQMGVDFSNVRDASVFCALEHERFLSPNLIPEDLDSSLSNYAVDSAVFAERFHSKFNQSVLYSIIASLKEYGLSK